VPFASYPICYWSGTLGPKLREGDRQAPEGFYTITIHQLHDGRRWTRSLDVGFPNAFDQTNKRSGSDILIHGGCNSVGCFAMTDRVNAEIYEIVSAALSAGVTWVPVHVFPFRMTDENFAAREADKWSGFWVALKQGYESFERTRLPPRISVCDKTYWVEDAKTGGDAEAGPVALCEPPDTIVASAAQQEDPERDAIPPILRSTIRPVRVAAPVQVAAALIEIPDKPEIEKAAPRKRSAARGCSASRPSCRRWKALRTNRMAMGRTNVARATANVRSHKLAKAR
jgi:hypothetical protein